MGGGGKTQSKLESNTIMEDFDSDLDGSDMSAALNYNYDVINLKDETTSAHFNAVKEVLDYRHRNTGDLNDSDEKFDAEKAIKSLSTLAIDVQISMILGEP